MEAITIITALLIVLGVVAYAMLDGFDLGVGNVFMFFSPEERGSMMSSIAPVWDGNETWLVFAGGMLFAAFPLVYSVVLPALYLPAVLMLAGLVFRGVSFEFRLKAKAGDRRLWDFTFFLGSVLASFLQGMLIGAAVSGITVENGHFAGGAFDFLTPLSVLTGIAAVIAYTLLGLGWLIYKIGGKTGERASRIMKPLLLGSFFLTLFIEYLMIKGFTEVRAALFGDLWRMAAVVALTVLAFVLVLSVLKSERDGILKFLLIVAIFGFSLLKKLAMFWPYAIFPTYTVFDAKNADPAMSFIFILSCIFVPLTIGYTVFVYYTFKGRMAKNDNFYN